jgi:hypothetical protein
MCCRPPDGICLSAFITTPPPRKRRRGLGCKWQRQNPKSDVSGYDSVTLNLSLELDVQLQSQDFTFDTPGAGPSNGQPQPATPLSDDEPHRLFEDEWDGNVPIDSDLDDGRPDSPTLADNAPWLNGLTAAAVLGQELEAEIVRTGGKCSCTGIVNCCSLNYPPHSTQQCSHCPANSHPLRDSMVACTTSPSLTVGNALTASNLPAMCLTFPN